VDDVRALILNGAPADDDVSAAVERALDSALAGRGWDVQRVHLRDLTIAYCQGCFDCWVKTPGVCQTRDAARDVTRALARSDLLVLLSPVTFGGYSSELKKALDRSIGIVLPFFTRIRGEVHHRARYGRYPALLGVGVLNRASKEDERTFATLVSRNAINFHAPANTVVFVTRDEPLDRMRTAIGQTVAHMTPLRRGAA
jgi:multimeric flavodoxin WrbA